MKRFLVFAWNTGDAWGGMHDLIGTADSLEEVEALISESRWELYQTYDILSGEDSMLDTSGE